MPDCREGRCARSVEVGRGCFRENRRRSGDATFFLPIRYEDDGYILDRKKKETLKNQNLLWGLVVSRGFEPRQTVPKTVVLPLHHETILNLPFFQKRCKGSKAFGHKQENFEKITSLSAKSNSFFLFG